MQYQRLLLLSAISLCLTGHAQQSIKLSELNLSQMWQEYGKVQIGESVTGEKAVINGQCFEDIHIESDFAGGGGFTEKESDITEKWDATRY